MAIYKAISSGNADTLAIWEIWDGAAWVAATALPGASDDVYTNNNIVTITTSQSYNSLNRSSLASPAITQGGQFQIDGANEITLTGQVNLEYGVLNIGELSGVKIINELKKGIKKDEKIIIDSPPGAACAVAATIEDIDYALLVTEPTPFGVSDMKIVEELLREEGIKFGMVINKAGIGNREIYDYCKEKNINIVGEIPFDIEIAKMYSSGRILSEKKEYREMFKTIVEKIKKEVENNG